MQPDRLGTAQWANPVEFAESNPFESEKFWIGRSVTEDQTLGYVDDRHICLVSGSRSGKGTSTIIPNLCQWPGSLIVVDPKGENATVTAVRRGPGSDDCDGLGQTVYVLDPFKVAHVPEEMRASFNPLDALDPESSGCLDDAGHLADAIVIQNPKSNDPFWEQSARILVKTLILHVLTSPEFKNRRNMLTIRDLILRGDQEAVDQLKEDGEEELPPPVKYLWFRITKNKAFSGTLAGYGETILGMLERSPRQFESVFQIAARNTEFLDSPAMTACVKNSSFKLSDLKKAPKGVSLYLSLPQRYMGEHFRWLRMILTLLIASMETTKGKPATGHSVLMCLDEFAGLKRMEVIENAVAQIAGYGVKLMFVLQSLEQLKATYEDNWETFLSNSGLKLFYGIEDHFTRDYISKFLGDTEIVRTTRTSSHSIGESLSATEGESTNTGISRSTNTGENWNKGISRGYQSGYGRSTNSKAWAFGIRDTAAIFRALTGNRQTGTSENWGTSEGASRSKGGSSGSSEGTSETKGSSASETRGFNTSESKGQNESVHKRPLITPDEIGRFFGRIDDKGSPIYPGMGLVLIAGCDPAFVRRINYFEDRWFIGKYTTHPDHLSSQQTRHLYDISLSDIGAQLIGYSLSQWPNMNYWEPYEIPDGSFTKHIIWLAQSDSYVKKGDPLFKISGLIPPLQRIKKGKFYNLNRDDFELTVYSPFSGYIKNTNSYSSLKFSSIPNTSTPYDKPLYCIENNSIHLLLESIDTELSDLAPQATEEFFNRCKSKSLFLEKLIADKPLKFLESIFEVVMALVIISACSWGLITLLKEFFIGQVLVGIIGTAISLFLAIWWLPSGWTVFSKHSLNWVLLSDPTRYDSKMSQLLRDGSEIPLFLIKKRVK